MGREGRRCSRRAVRGLPTHQRQISGRCRDAAGRFRPGAQGGDDPPGPPQEEAEKNEHPLNRIISVEDDAQGVVINTTDIHLPRRIGEAVKRAFHGEIEDHFEKDGYFVRVDWTREARIQRGHRALNAGADLSVISEDCIMPPADRSPVLEQ